MPSRKCASLAGKHRIAWTMDLLPMCCPPGVLLKYLLSASKGNEFRFNHCRGSLYYAIIELLHSNPL